jgi:GTPase Era involved in 16S rRNA processing
MLAFLHLLQQRYERVLSYIPLENEMRRHKCRRNLQSLVFAEAVLKKVELNKAQPDHPLQIAVLGPTQAGKSSIINWLLQKNLAEVSPLAGFTIHPQGFALDVAPERLGWIDDYFTGYHRCDRGTLPRDRYDCFLLEAASIASRSPLQATVLWDTPDFDSVDAEDYRPAVSQVAALADVVLLVVSKDKYADLSVWELLELLAPLAQPTIICFNKIEPSSYPTLVESLQQKWRMIRRDQPPPPIIAVPYLEPIEENGLTPLSRERLEVLNTLHKALRSVQRKRQEQHAWQLLKAHWKDWLEPVKAEHYLAKEWNKIIAEAVQDSILSYQRNYLNHPHHYETFQRALAELLRLLEIPGVAGALLAMRKVVTWPVRQLTRLGQSVIRHSQAAEKSGEVMVLAQTLEHLLTRVNETLLLKQDEDPSQQTWWIELRGLLKEVKSPLTSRFEAKVGQYMRAFQPEIERTAHGLYEHLQEHPAVLNGLRATRVTTDAAALAVALHTGGIGAQDFIIAPAVLSLTSILTESALGHYMDKAADDLKAKQVQFVRKLFQETVNSSLVGLPNRMNRDKLFNIPPQTLEAIEAKALTFQ